MDHLYVARQHLPAIDNPAMSCLAHAMISIAESLETLAGTVRPDAEGQPAVLTLTKYVERKRAAVGQPGVRPGEDAGGPCE